MAHRHAAPVGIAEVRREGRRGLDGDAMLFESGERRGVRGARDRERDELERPRRDGRFAAASPLDHHDRPTGVEPRARRRLGDDREAEDVAVEAHDGAAAARSKGDVVDAHAATIPVPALACRWYASGVTKILVATHGHCFDGLCSAVAFTHLRRALGGDLSFEYFGAGYGPGASGVDPRRMRGDENAILDFRFSRSEKLTWYFDHHVSAFATPEDRAVYEAHVAAHDGTERRMFHDGAYPSCTKYVADIGRSVFGVDFEPLGELVRWADVIDSAAFDSAEMAVARKEPPLQLMTVIEHLGDDAMLARMIKRLLTESLDAVASSEAVQTAFAPLQKAHLEFMELVRAHAALRGDAVLVDLTDRVIDVGSKFVTYALFPESLYSIVVTRSQTKCKLSIGYNPWAPRPRTHHIASICERYGGGGHAVVGAVSLPAGDVARAKQIANEIAEELSRP
jgi:hypothetical protein